MTRYEAVSGSSRPAAAPERPRVRRDEEDMKIGKDTVVSMEYELRLGGSDEVIDSSDGEGPLSFLIGHEVQPEDGYGVRDESKLIAVPRSVLPQDFEIEPGLPLELEDEQGESFPVWIAGVEGDQVMLDGNHPLADETLKFHIKITEVRKATATELTHGHVHGEGDHHHH
jgi:FKBP-type peptidyl-prolyl cis-trans isomerase SlyD